MEASFLFLGSGASMGVPIIGCPCAICQRKEERLRSSALLTIGGKKLLIDAGPDFRRQALLHKVEDIDALILTHSHYDHIGGLEDLRIIYYQKKEKIPCYLSTETLQEWRTKTHITPLFSPYILPEKSGPCTIEGLDACAFYFWQNDRRYRVTTATSSIFVPIFLTFSLFWYEMKYIIMSHYFYCSM